MKPRPVFVLALLAVAAGAFAASAAPPPGAAPAEMEVEAPASENPECALREEPAPAPAAPGWTFEGCFTFFPAGPCRDVFRDSNGVLWICGACGTTQNPGPGKCSRLTGSGWWCS